MGDRDPATGRFTKDNKANPGGRPKGVVSVVEMIDEAVSPSDWREIFDEVVRRAKRGNLKALEILLDRRFGKPTQVNENKNTGTVTVIWTSHRPPETSK